MKNRDCFRGKWINGHGDTLSVRRLFGRRYWLAFKVLSAGSRPRRRWEFAQLMERDRLLFDTQAIVGPSW